MLENTVQQDTLFPYALKNVEDFLKNNWNEEATKTVVAALREQAEEDKKSEVEGVVAIPAGESEDIIPEIVKNVEWQMSQDRKTGSLKTLQGLVWAKGYKDGSIKGHVYDDVHKAFERWTESGRKIYIYSSGSVDAQKLLFEHSEQGNLLKYLSGHYDTKVGAKREKESYESILKNIDASPEEALFLTDVYAEAKAAKDAGLNVVLLDRPGNSELSEEERKDFPVIATFSDLSFAEAKEANGAAAATNGKRKIEETSDDAAAEQDNAQEQPPSKVVKVEEDTKTESVENGTATDKDKVETASTTKDTLNTADDAEAMEVDGGDVATKKSVSKEDKEEEKMEEDTEKVENDAKKDTEEKVEVMDTDKTESVTENKKSDIEKREPEKEEKEAAKKNEEVELVEKAAEKEVKETEEEKEKAAEKEEAKNEKEEKMSEDTEKAIEKQEPSADKDKNEKVSEKKETASKSAETEAAPKGEDEKDGEKKEENKGKDAAVKKDVEQNVNEAKPEKNDAIETEAEKSADNGKAEAAAIAVVSEPVVEDKKATDKTVVAAEIPDKVTEPKEVEVTSGVEEKSDSVVDEVAAEAKEDGKTEEDAKPSSDVVESEKTNGEEALPTQPVAVEEETSKSPQEVDAESKTAEVNGAEAAAAAAAPAPATKSTTNGSSSTGDEEKNGDSDKENDTSLSNCEADEAAAEKTNGTTTPSESINTEDVSTSEIKAKKVIETVTPTVTPVPPIEAES
uniref:Enolase-phosphatase E1 n=1 Tax=Anopheles epiroticus TaxID=199890 RepID=A0A182PUC0_9DIPT